MDTAGNGRSGGGSDVGFVARRPAVAVAVWFGVGIFAHRVLPHGPVVWMGVLAVLLVAGWAVGGRGERVASILIGIAVAVAGVAAAQLASFYYPGDHVSAFVGDAPRLAQVELRLDHPPRVLSGTYSGTRQPVPPKQVVTARVVAVRTWEGWRRASGEVLVQNSQPHPRLAVGQTVRVTGMLQRPAAAMNP